jgi:hypothetical protein
MNNYLPAMLAVGFLVAGCSGEKAGDTVITGAKAPAAAGVEAVAAVLQSAGTPVAKLAFVVVTRPVVGAPSDLRLDFSAAAVIADLQVRAESASLTIDPATAVASVSIDAGKTVSHQLRFTPQREGLAEVTVRLRAGADGAETVYVIPVLVAATATTG